MSRILALMGVSVAVLIIGVPIIRAETAELELQTLPESYEYRTKEYYLNLISPQHFYLHREMSDQWQGEEFEQIVKKEPKYSCERPFKAVAKIGSYRYAFALDSTKLAAEGFNRLYLDANRNGDLTDEKPIRARPMDGIFGGSYRHREFPPQTLVVEAGGQKFEMPFALSVGSHVVEDDLFYVSVSLKASAYRHGKIQIDGKPHEIILLDYNSNGTFNDEFWMDEEVHGQDAPAYPHTGDMVLIDPDHKAPRYSGYSPCDSPDRQYLSKLVNVEGRYYRISVTPAGDKVTLEPAELPLGSVVNASGPYRAVIYGKEGLIKIAGDKDKPVAVPAGKWRLLEYQLDLTDAKPASKSKEAATQPAPAKKKKSLAQRLASIFGGDGDEIVFSTGPKLTLAQARATHEFKPMTVAQGKTERLVFGPPYKPIVRVAYVNDRDVHLQLDIIGSAGEYCDALMVKGSQPGKPSFRIMKNDGTLVKKGQFEYG
ncbi:MAG TPA: hypothetical protein PK458_07040 [Phycisphaerae bacterium]|nr:hypothetical protein [Phycisphaerae bacterium]HOJ76158.1 hypothetical protein [Phycisphaerae bacterium]HOM53451.1 hypothetical protein [Phycisphaerae bacterium]HON68378.1 hypothetical protein [Phycisphaerae bacterium]HPP28726.1 hypothetical protein [Phycisphaerae bacterium]